MQINKDRLKQRFQVIQGITATEVGQTRFSYSEEDRQTRSYLLGILKNSGGLSLE